MRPKYWLKFCIGAQTRQLYKEETKETAQIKFLLSILAVPYETPNAQSRLKRGMRLIQITAWKMTIIYWFKIQLFPIGLTWLILTDRLSSPWQQAVEHKLTSYGIFNICWLWSSQSINYPRNKGHKVSVGSQQVAQHDRMWINRGAFEPALYLQNWTNLNWK